jgi:hypothetical protein
VARGSDEPPRPHPIDALKAGQPIKATELAACTTVGLSAKSRTMLGDLETRII